MLENHFDPKYEPKREEVEEYGKWLGMELPKHEPLLWIARDGLKAPLPQNWKACKSEMRLTNLSRLCQMTTLGKPLKRLELSR